MNISRREFLKMAAYAAAATGATQFDIFKLNKAIADNGLPNVVWFEGLGDSGCVVSLANYFDGTSAGIESVLLSSIELKFSSVLMGAAGQLAIDAAQAAYDDYLTTPYVLVLTGAITNIDGYCTIGQDSTNGLMQLVDSLNKWEARAAAVLFVGHCACYGGVNTIGGKPNHNDTLVSPPFHDPDSGAIYTGTRNANYDRNKSLYIPGCPSHPDWVVLSIVHFLTNGMPTRDEWFRPVSLMGTDIFANTIHSQCARKAQHDAGLFAENVGDPVKCMRKVGCRGKETYGDCSSRGWNSVGTYCCKPGINHICIGCTQPSFPDVPFNRQLTKINTTP
jgi:hydrogenase small subunit